MSIKPARGHYRSAQGNDRYPIQPRPRKAVVIGRLLYSYAPGRGADHAIALLKGFAGILQTDGYGAYKTLVEADRARGAIALAHCWAHARRRFFELAKGGSAPIAEEALRRIAGLYAIEAEIRGQDADTRKTMRQARSRPLAQDLKLWLEVRLTTVAGRSPLAEAIRYTLARWEGLTRFLGDGRIELDTNPVERSIRPIVGVGSLCPSSSST